MILSKNLLKNCIFLFYFNFFSWYSFSEVKGVFNFIFNERKIKTWLLRRVITTSHPHSPPPSSNHSHPPKINLHPTTIFNKMYLCNGIHPKCHRDSFNTTVPLLHTVWEESLHLEPILWLIASLTQDQCCPWKKCNLFVPKTDLSIP